MVVPFLLNFAPSMPFRSLVLSASILRLREPHIVRALRAEHVTSVACGAYCTAAIANKREATRSGEGQGTGKGEDGRMRNSRQGGFRSGHGGEAGSSVRRSGHASGNLGGSASTEAEFPSEGRLWVWGQHQVRAGQTEPSTARH